MDQNTEQQDQNMEQCGAKCRAKVICVLFRSQTGVLPQQARLNTGITEILEKGLY